jgi:hypothetical protein
MSAAAAVAEKSLKNFQLSVAAAAAAVAQPLGLHLY